MNWLRRLFGRQPVLDAEQALALAAYCSRPSVPGASPLAGLRFVVADVETTGIDVLGDRLISIGAIEVIDGRVVLSSAFEVVFRQPEASANANILIHGIDGTTQLAGLEPAEASLQFLGFIEDAPLVGFHADFDRVMINRANKEAIGCTISNHWLDLAYLAPALLSESGQAQPQGLDAWMARTGITNQLRHNALADALATAQLLQVVLAQAHARKITTLTGLVKLEQDQRWLSRR